MAAALPPRWTKASAVSSIRVRAARLEDQECGEVPVGCDRGGSVDRPGLGRTQGGLGESPGGAQLGARRSGPEGGGDRLGGPLELGGPAGARRSRDERAADAIHGARKGVGGKSARDPGQVALGDRERRGASRQPPAGRLRRFSQGPLLGRRVPKQQGEQLAAAALALALLLALRLRVALDRVGGQLVDAREDRLGQDRELVWVDTMATSRRG